MKLQTCITPSIFNVIRTSTDSNHWTFLDESFLHRLTDCITSGNWIEWSWSTGINDLAMSATRYYWKRLMSSSKLWPGLAESTVYIRGTCFIGHIGQWLPQIYKLSSSAAHTTKPLAFRRVVQAEVSSLLMWYYGGAPITSRLNDRPRDKTTPSMLDD